MRYAHKQTNSDLPTPPTDAPGSVASAPGIQAGQWRERWAGRVHAPEDLVRFVDAVGCCTKVPPAGYPDFPNLCEAMGELDPSAPDTWFWKDDLHVEKRIYYTRVIGGQPGFVSCSLLPVLMATNGAVADEMIFSGAMSSETQSIYHAIEAHGPIPIRELKRMLTPDAKRGADRVLIELERKFLITKTGITGRTRGTYGYIWDLVERWTPELLSAAGRLGRNPAEATLREHLAAFGVQPDSPFYTKLLGWTP